MPKIIRFPEQIALVREVLAGERSVRQRTVAVAKALRKVYRTPVVDELLNLTTYLRDRRNLGVVSRDVILRG
ncbi:MAG: hypothetical protein KDB11_33155 [Planctomycetales bacterium]|nr:hypothetical protein [Planctomycetales bacterium]